MNQVNHERARFNMVEQQIKPANVLNPAVLEALYQVQRDTFVPTEYSELAFADALIPLGHGATMLSPKLDSLALQALQLGANDRVLEVGTGSGYMASLLAQLSAQVSTVEMVPELVVKAKENLRRAGVYNVTVHEGNGLDGLPGDAPFDAIMISGSLDAVPQALLDQLKVGGRLFAITGDAPAMEVQRITRVANDAWQTEVLFETDVPRLCAPQTQRFVF